MTQAEIQSIMIEKIRRNRISTTEVADCLGKTGAITRVNAVNRGHFRVGPVFWAYAFNETNWDVHEQVRSIPAGSILLVESFNCAGRAIFGELVAKFLLLYRDVAAIIVQGTMRDMPHLIKENWPIWCEGSNPVGCFNTKPSVAMDPAVITDRRTRYGGAIAVCDDCGVVVIGPENMTPAFLQKLDEIEQLEDIWFDCIDRLKYDTFETVCLKKYLEKRQ